MFVLTAIFASSSCLWIMRMSSTRYASSSLLKLPLLLLPQLHLLQLRQHALDLAYPLANALSFLDLLVVVAVPLLDGSPLADVGANDVQHPVDRRLHGDEVVLLLLAFLFFDAALLLDKLELLNETGDADEDGATATRHLVILCSTFS